MKTNIFKPKRAMSIYPLTIDAEHFQEKITRKQGIAFHQIFIVRAGSGVLSVAGESYALEKGDMFFMKKKIGHSYHGNTEFVTAFMGFDGEMCDKLFKFYQLEDFGVYRGKNSQASEAMIFDLYRDFDAIGSYDLLSSRTYSIITEFFHQALKPESQPIEAVKSYLEANFAHPVTLSDIMEIYPHSKAKLCRDFPARYGMTIFQMLTQIRLSHAKAMLKSDPGIKLKSVAEYCGFSDLSYFCKMYKREFGKSPKG